MAMGTVTFYLLLSLYMYLFYSFTEIQEREENSWILNVKHWKYTSILQQCGFTYYQNYMEHITLQW
jgi:hypothetical protein